MSASTRARWAQAGALTTAGTVAATILCCLPFATGIVGATLAAVVVLLLTASWWANWVIYWTL